MKSDLTQSFGEICGSNDATKEYINKIRTHLTPRSSAHKWANRLRFIAVDEECSLEDGNDNDRDSYHDEQGLRTHEVGDDQQTTHSENEVNPTDGPIEVNGAIAEDVISLDGASCFCLPSPCRLVHGWMSKLQRSCGARDFHERREGIGENEEINISQTPGNNSNEAVGRVDDADNSILSIRDGSFRESTTISQEISTCACVERSFFPLEGASKYIVTESSSRELEGCTHYLAVSYCWKQQPVSDRSYLVKTGDVTRDNRAPKEVLDRAISYAAYNGLRLIWIDQECIEQSDREDQEFGIQSMDLVYERAADSVALFNVCIQKQDHLDVFFKVIQNEEFSQPDDFINAIEVLELILEDRWTSRAWCFQEAASAGDSMTLLIQCDPELVAKDEWARDIWMAVPGEIQISIAELHGAASHISTWLPGVFPEYQAIIQNLNLEERIEAISEKILKIGGMAFPSTSSVRYACNAAQALDLMATRKNSRLLDRLAILANLCNYPLRLNTKTIEDMEKSTRENFSFSICVYTLAIANGDISLLFGSKMVSTAKHGPRIRDSVVFSWVPSVDTALHNMPYPEEFSEQYFLEDSELQEDGLSLLGYLWKVDHKLRLTSVSKDLIASWQREVSKTGWIYDNKLLTGLAKDIFSNILLELRSNGLNELGDTLWYNAGTGFPDLMESDLRIHASPSERPSTQVKGAWGDVTFHPDGLRWIIDTAIQGRPLWCGRRVPSHANDNQAVCCSQVESNTGIKSRRRPISWTVQMNGQSSNGTEILVAQDLVRGST
ncbi:heterokaryon incompatibility protein-domain-containing protein [Tricladium varicosporioides]|nr:heterokaryon incompatibility protein-domain-containing protein [Hymenoscyphus varicosporioides]